VSLPKPYYEDSSCTGKPGPKPGYKQSPEHIAKRIRTGPQHHAWKGDAISVRSGRDRAQRLYPDIGPCVQCGSNGTERHHLDDNTANNHPDNIVALCRRCHMEADGRLAALRVLAKQNQNKAVNARWKYRQDTPLRSGDPCPACGKRLGVTATRNKDNYRLTYIGCRKARGGCGFNGGSIKEVLS
jgi:5-methylcytosine-specific restriction endonuclease McrA